MPEERAAFDAASARVGTGMPLGRERETQTADWATETPSSGDDYDRDSLEAASRNVVKTPTGAAGGAKLKPSMLCKKLKKRRRKNNESNKNNLKKRWSKRSRRTERDLQTG
jgi:hypothetical protein